MIGKLMKDWAGNLKRGEVCACFVFAVLFAWAVLLPELGKFGLKLFSRSGYRSSRLPFLLRFATKSSRSTGKNGSPLVGLRSR